MSTNKTENLNLHSWVAEDQVRMEEFNENFSLIDAAAAAEAAAREDADAALETVIATKAEIVAGSYTGDGSTTRTIALGFAPKLVLIGTRYGFPYASGYVYCGFAAQGKSMERGALTLTSSGFTVAYNTNGARTNENGSTYYYFAVK